MQVNQHLALLKQEHERFRNLTSGIEPDSLSALSVDQLIVLKIESGGTVTEVYNGPGTAPWNESGKKQSNGQRPISLHKLRKLMCCIELHQRIPLCGPLNSTN